MDPRITYHRRAKHIDAIRKWAELHGDAPKVNDWRNVRDAEFIESYGNGWPSYLTVIRYSPDGTWDGMIRAAGFEPRGRGRPNSQ
jgi:hypothetical protein